MELPAFLDLVKEARALERKAQAHERPVPDYSKLEAPASAVVLVSPKSISEKTWGELLADMRKAEKFRAAMAYEKAFRMSALKAPAERGEKPAANDGPSAKKEERNSGLKFTKKK